MLLRIDVKRLPNAESSGVNTTVIFHFGLIIFFVHGYNETKNLANRIFASIQYAVE